MRVLIVGAAGHVGSAAAAALRDRHEVIEVGRNTDPAVDLGHPESIDALFRRVGRLHAVISAVGAVPFKPLSALTREDYLSGFEGKVLNQIDLVRIGVPYLEDGGSFTLTTGVVGREPIATGVAAAMANGAVEGFVRAVSVELPRGIRINAVSPSVLEEAEGYHASFPGFVPVPGRVVGQAFVRAVEGVQTGRVIAVD